MAGSFQSGKEHRLACLVREKRRSKTKKVTIKCGGAAIKRKKGSTKTEQTDDVMRRDV